MNNNSFSLATTSDGSFSLHESKLDELYHNRAGAFSEALVTYVQPAWQFLQGSNSNLSKPVKVLDSCFGLGYNSLALVNNNVISEFDFEIDAIEIDRSVLELIPEVIGQPCLNRLNQLLQSGNKNLNDFVGGKVEIERAKFEVFICDLRQFLKDQLVCKDYRLVFHDPFSPKKVPELWSIDLLQHYYRLMAAESILLTYSSAPAVRGALLDLGFQVFRTTALGGKSGGTMAVKSGQQNFVIPPGEFIMPLTKEEQKRLATSSRVPYRDQDLCLPKDDILARRETEQKEFILREAVALNNTGAQKIF